ncbi:MAG: alpha/beta hydrolase-fold protein [Planctomycetota bacterium]|nr:alpha/beta hydrolase-fold protein [Planctomycetota bacterium]
MKKLYLGSCTLLVIFTCFVSTSTAQSVDLFDAGRGDVSVYIPASYNPANPTPILMALHGYSFSGATIEVYFGFSQLAEQNGFIYLYPDGSLDSVGLRFWNATDACCDFDGAGYDDVGYLTTLLDMIEAEYNIDPNRVHLVGHSNGGFMAHRLACEDPERFASIASLAGAVYSDPIDCTAIEPVHVLQIHGTLDPIISYYGGVLEAPYPSAMETCTQWAARNNCSGPPVSGSNINLDGFLLGNETTVERWQAGCDPNGSVELWSIIFGGHLPTPSSQMSSLIFQHFLDHPKIPTPSLSEFMRGDTNGDQALDLSDVVLLLVHLFSNGTIDCREAANCNSDASLDVSDGIYLLGYLFSSGPAPGAPFGTCASDPVLLDCLLDQCP